MDYVWVVLDRIESGGMHVYAICDNEKAANNINKNLYNGTATVERMPIYS